MIQVKICKMDFFFRSGQMLHTLYNMDLVWILRDNNIYCYIHKASQLDLIILLYLYISKKTHHRYILCLHHKHI